MDTMNGPIDAVALGCCLRASGAEKAKRDAFLQKFEHSDDQARQRMLLRERQMLLRMIHEKEEAIGQIDYMLHLLTNSIASPSGRGAERMRGGEGVGGRN